jgi:hypothetical protein
MAEAPGQPGDTGGTPAPPAPSSDSTGNEFVWATAPVEDASSPEPAAPRETTAPVETPAPVAEAPKEATPSESPSVHAQFVAALEKGDEAEINRLSLEHPVLSKILDGKANGLASRRIEIIRREETAKREAAERSAAQRATAEADAEFNRKLADNDYDALTENARRTLEYVRQQQIMAELNNPQSPVTRNLRQNAMAAFAQAVDQHTIFADVSAEARARAAEGETAGDYVAAYTQALLDNQKAAYEARIADMVPKAQLASEIEAARADERTRLSPVLRGADTQVSHPNGRANGQRTHDDYVADLRRGGDALASWTSEQIDAVSRQWDEAQAARR